MDADEIWGELRSLVHDPKANQFDAYAKARQLIQSSPEQQAQMRRYVQHELGPLVTRWIFPFSAQSAPYGPSISAQVLHEGENFDLALNKFEVRDPTCTIPRYQLTVRFRAWRPCRDDITQEELCRRCEVWADHGGEGFRLYGGRWFDREGFFWDSSQRVSDDVLSTLTFRSYQLTRIEGQLEIYRLF